MILLFTFVYVNVAIQQYILDANYANSDELYQIGEDQYYIIQQISNGTFIYKPLQQFTDQYLLMEQQCVNICRLIFQFPSDGDINLIFSVTQNKMATVSSTNKITADYFDYNGYYLKKMYQQILIPPNSFRSGDTFYITNFMYSDNRTYQYNFRISHSPTMLCPQNCTSATIGFCDEVTGNCGCDDNYMDLDCSKTAQPLVLNKKIANQSILGTKYYYFQQTSMSDLSEIIVEIGIQNLLNASYSDIKVYYLYENFVCGAATPLCKDNYSTFSQDQPTRGYIFETSQMPWNDDLSRYQRLLITVISANQILIYFNVSEPSSDSGINTNLMLIYFLVSLAIVLILIWIIITVIRYRQARARVHDETTLQQNQRRSQQKPQINSVLIDQYMPQIFFNNLKKLPKFREHANALQVESCSICLLEFEGQSICRFTPCLHIFHGDCLQQWVLKHENCPICRTDLTEKSLEAFQKEESKPELQLLTRNNSNQQGGIRMVRGDENN